MKSSFSGQLANATRQPESNDLRRANWLERWHEEKTVDGRMQHYVSGEQVDLETDCAVISDESPARSIWLVRSGILRLQRFSLDGRRQILSLSLPGEIVGFQRQWREGMSVESATRCCLCRVDRREFEGQLGSDRHLREEFYKQQHDQIERLRWLTWSIGTLRPEERLSAFLALCTRFMPYQPLPDGSAILTMVLSRLDIADLLATTVESISRITHSLAEAGVIEIRDPSHFRILDLQELTELGRIGASFETMPFQTRRRSGQRIVKTIACASCEFEAVC